MAHVALAAVALAIGAAAARAEEPPRTSRLFDLAKPAVVMVKVQWKAQIEVPTPDVDTAKTTPVLNAMVAKFKAGQISKRDAMVGFYKEIVQNWSAYLIAKNPMRTLDTKIGATGSGWCVSPDGYIVTNAHVAAPDQNELKAQMAQVGLTEFLKHDTQMYLNTWAATIGGQPPADILELTKAAVVGFYKATMAVSKVEQSTFASTGVANSNGKVTEKDIKAEVGVHGEPVPGKDVAILKIDATSQPTLPLGDSKALKTGDKIYAVGYPGAATFHPLLSETSAVEPTLTSGLLSARKTMKDGWDILQTDAATTHGNSGGPALDEQGRVVGIVTFGSIDNNTGQEVQGLNFIVPISVIQEFLDKGNVKPGESPVTKAYAEALSLMDRQHYRTAVKKLQEINAASPGHPYVQEQLEAAQKAIADGKDRTYLMPALYIGGLVILVPLWVVLVVIALARRGRAKAGV